MLEPVFYSLTLLANAAAVTDVMRSYVTPMVVTLSAVASLACVFFLIMGGMQYMSSTGNPEKLQRAKTVIKNSLIGLTLVLAASTTTAILSSAYSGSDGPAAQELPTLQEIEDIENDSGVTDVLVNAVVGLLRKAINTAAEPFLKGLSYFINRTPLMAKNPNVFNLWLAIVGITDVLFVLVVALLGFHVMSFSTFGFEELDIRHLIPRIALAFLLINTSIFAVDGLISLSNAMIYALQSGFPSTDIWATLISISEKSADMGIAGLLVLAAFLILVVMLLVYYLMRLVALYLGAILSPLVVLLWLIPVFRDFAVTAFKTYAATIFILFVHAVIMLLAASMLSGLNANAIDGQPGALMALLVGLATVLTLLKTQHFMQEVATVASIPRSGREMATAFKQGVGYMSSSIKAPVKAANKTAKGFKKARTWHDNRQHKKPKVTHRIQSSGNSNKSIAARKHQNSLGAEPAGRKKTTPANDPPPLRTGETRKAKNLSKTEGDKP